MSLITIILYIIATLIAFIAIFDPQIKLKDKIGVIFRLESFWIGIHYSKYLNRLHINILPCITIWISLKSPLTN